MEGSKNCVNNDNRKPEKKLREKRTIIISPFPDIEFLIYFERKILIHNYVYRISSNSSRPPNRPRPRIDRVRRLEANEIQRALELNVQCGQLNVNRL